MSLLAFLLLGLVAGFIASRIIGGGEGILGSLIVGVVGAMLGGFLFNLAGERGVTGFNLWSILVATAGASLLLLLFHGTRSRRTI